MNGANFHSLTPAVSFKSNRYRGLIYLRWILSLSPAVIKMAENKEGRYQKFTSTAIEWLSEVRLNWNIGIYFSWMNGAERKKREPQIQELNENINEINHANSAIQFSFCLLEIELVELELKTFNSNKNQLQFKQKKKTWRNGSNKQIRIIFKLNGIIFKENYTEI